MNRYFFPLCFVFIAVGMYILYIAPKFTEIHRELDKAKELVVLLEQAGTAKTQLAQLEAVKASFPAGYDQSLRAILPSSVDATRLIIDVNGIAELRGLHLKSPQVSFGTEGKNSSSVYSTQTVVFTVSAPYSEFRSFLHDLESSLALRDVSLVSFSSAASPGDFRSPELQAHDYQLTIVTYSLHS